MTARLFLLSILGLATSLLAKPTVIASNYPLAFFTEEIGGDLVEIVTLYPEDSDPAFWKPKDEDIQKLQQADLLVFNGAKYERWTNKVSLDEDKIVDTSFTFRNRFIEEKDGELHSHGAQGEHRHYNTAFTTWLAPSNAATQARAILDGLVELLPEHKEQLSENELTLRKSLLKLSSQLSEKLEPYRNKTIVTSHPVYQYLAQNNSLNKVNALHWEPDMKLAKEDLDELKSHAPVALFIWEAEPSAENKKLIAPLVEKQIVFSPLATKPDEGDFLSVMEKQIEAID